jgi:xanthine dehydrogenase accessory factor
MAHHYADDRDALSVLAASDVAYIGVLGPRARTERMLADLGLGGPELMRRLFAPVGLDIGTDGAEQVALSVLAEILAVRSGRAAASLRTRRVAIHATQ